MAGRENEFAIIRFPTPEEEENPFVGLAKNFTDRYLDTSEGCRTLASEIIAGAFLAEQRTGGNQRLLVVTNNGFWRLLQEHNIRLPDGASVMDVAGIVNAGLAALREEAGLTNPNAQNRIL